MLVVAYSNAGCNSICFCRWGMAVGGLSFDVGGNCRCVLLPETLSPYSDVPLFCYYFWPKSDGDDKPHWSEPDASL